MTGFRPRNPARRPAGLRGTALVATLAFGLMLVVKIEFKNPGSNVLFYAYGLTVTAVIFVSMAVALLFYRDPAVTARARLAGRAPRGRAKVRAGPW